MPHVREAFKECIQEATNLLNEPHSIFKVYKASFRRVKTYAEVGSSYVEKIIDE